VFHLLEFAEARKQVSRTAQHGNGCPGNNLVTVLLSIAYCSAGCWAVDLKEQLQSADGRILLARRGGGYHGTEEGNRHGWMLLE
jgi:hypothetical protein